MLKSKDWKSWAALGVLAVLTGCAGATGPAGHDGTLGEPGRVGEPGQPGLPGEPAQVDLLNARLGGWLPENRAALNALLASRGRTSAAFDPMRPPVAVFDWDNTVLKNDIGDATFFWMVNNDKILQPPARDWSLTNSALTTAARAALNAACDGLAAPGAPLPTGAGTAAANACADTLYAIYSLGRVPPGGAADAAAWTGEVTTTINQPYAWLAQLMAGYRPQDIRDFAQAAFDENNWAPIGATQTVGTLTTATGYVRIYEQMADLIDALDAAGFDVWIVSASPQYAVEQVAREVGIERDHVVGIRSVVTEGRLTYDLQGCGPVADREDTLITFDEGKRCWINQVIFHIPAATALERAPVAQRPVLVGGDSDTDIAMIKDATDVKVVLNRNKTQLMCNAYAGARERWLIQPMFLAPNACRATPYACDTAVDAAGVRIVDEAGAPFSTTFTDTICTLPAP